MELRPFKKMFDPPLTDSLVSLKYKKKRGVGGWGREISCSRWLKGSAFSLTRVAASELERVNQAARHKL